MLLIPKNRPGWQAKQRHTSTQKYTQAHIPTCTQAATHAKHTHKHTAHTHTHTHSNIHNHVCKHPHPHSIHKYTQTEMAFPNCINNLQFDGFYSKQSITIHISFQSNTCTHLPARTHTCTCRHMTHPGCE